jgi:predicted nucleic acid-binding protein
LLVGVELADDTGRPTLAAFVRSVRRTGRPRGAHDLIIAATAAARNRLVVSSDSTAFADLPGVPVRS